VAWNNANLDTAIFGGTYSAGGKVVTIGSNITVNQIQVLTGSTGANRYDIGASGTQNDFAVTFGGTYSPTFPSITGSTTGFLNTQLNAKITGSPSGGLVISHGSNIITPGTSGRLAFINANNDFTGDLVVVGGNLSVSTVHQNFGNAANKLVLNGGALFFSTGAAVNTPLSRSIQVNAASGISTNATTAGLQVLDLTGPVVGSANLTRYSNVSGTTTVSELRLSGDMSGYTGTFENTGTSANALVTIQSTATSAGAWKLTGGTLKLNTSTDNAAIANGAGKSDLLMNGGTLDVNGKNETINGLAGATGIVQNALTATTATLTLGDGDATANFGGTVRDNAGTGGILALTKTGAGIQTLGGSNTYTGATIVSAGTLLVSGALGNTAVTVEPNAAIGGNGDIAGSVHFKAGADFIFSTSQTLTLNGASVTFDGFGVANLVGLDNTVDNGSYTLIDGTAPIDTSNVANFGLANAHDLGGGKQAYFSNGSLNLVVIPEPATALLAGLGLLGWLRRRRRD